MELEFDKEIDAILRKARSGVAVTSTAEPHPDADTIAAFAENALPDKASLHYIEHFADCDRCRKQLAFAMQMSNEAEAASASAVSEPVAATAIPWYQTFFKAPNLALAMGTLVLVFSSILGYLVIQKQNAEQSATVSQVTEPEQDRGGPNFGDEEGTSNIAPLSSFMATANPTPPSANSAANTSAVAPGESSGSLGRTDSSVEKPAAGSDSNSTRSGQFQIDGASGSENNFIVDGQEAGRAQAPAKSASAPPPQAATDLTTAGAALERDEKKPNDAGKLKEESKDDQLAKKQAEDRGYRDMPRAASKVGPSRAGPVQNQSNQMNSNMAVTRVVGGKTFNNREGAWYDSAYHGQATINYRRGTTEYKKLDGGLRSIADTLGGTVVVVWKAKAYRIQ